MTTETSCSAGREWWLDKEKQYWVLVGGRFHLVPDAESVLLPGWGEFDAFVVRREYGWTVIAAVTGEMLVGRNDRARKQARRGDYSATPEQAVERAVKALEQIGPANLRGAIRKAIEQADLSPRYRWDDEEAE